MRLTAEMRPRGPVCYPSPTMAADQAHRVQGDRRPEGPALRRAAPSSSDQLTTIEEERSRRASPSSPATWASTTSPPTPARRPSSARRTCRSRTTSATCCRRSTGRSSASMTADVRNLRALRQADREGADQGAALRRPLHQGRAGGDRAARSRGRRARRRGRSGSFGAAGLRLPARPPHEGSGPNALPVDDPVEVIPGVLTFRFTIEPRRRVQPRAGRALVLRVRRRVVRLGRDRRVRLPPRELQSPPWRSGSCSAARSATSPTASRGASTSRATWWTSSTCRSGPCSTSPTRPS